MQWSSQSGSALPSPVKTKKNKNILRTGRIEVTERGRRRGGPQDKNKRNSRSGGRGGCPYATTSCCSQPSETFSEGLVFGLPDCS